MPDSDQFLDCFCESVCRNIIAEEQEKLNQLYTLPPQLLKERERVELVQLSVELSLLAQKYVQDAFSKKDIPYGHTAWKEVSEQLPPFSYEYIDWESVPIPATGHAHGKGGQAGKKKSDAKNLVKKIPNSLRKIPDKLREKKEGPRTVREMSSRESMIHDAEIERQREVKSRIEKARQRNFRRVDAWCGELRHLLVPVIRKYQRMEVPW